MSFRKNKLGKVGILSTVFLLSFVFMSGSGLAAEAAGRSDVMDTEVIKEETIEAKEDVGNILVSEVRFRENTVTLAKGKSKTLKVQVLPEDAADKRVVYQSSNPSAVSVSEDGKVTARQKGTAIITAESADGSQKTAACKVTVRNTLVKSVAVNIPSASLGVGRSYQIPAVTVKPKNADVRSVTYQSSDSCIAEVSKRGKIRAKKVGTCEITITAKDGSQRKTSFHVTVRKYQRDAKYYQISDEIKLPDGGYSVSTKNIGLKVIKINKKLLGRTDARYTYATKNAVKRFQKKKHLKVTGTVNKKAWLAMGFSKKDWYDLGTYCTKEKVNYKSSRKSYTDAILKTAKEYAKAGTEYRVGCSGKPGTYVDCSGLIYQCLYSAGINPDTNIVDHALAKYEYTSNWLSRDSKLGKTVSYGKKKPGDIVFYCKSRGSVVVHVGIYAGKGKIYDSWPGIGVTKRNISFGGYRVSKVVRIF